MYFEKQDSITKNISVKKINIIFAKILGLAGVRWFKVILRGQFM